jgi:hypothetical protein
MKRDKLYLIYISECIERVESYVGSGGTGLPVFEMCSFTTTGVDLDRV